MAEGTGYDQNDIKYDNNLYMASISYHCHLIATLFQKIDVLFLVGHNDALSELAGHLCSQVLGNVPTCGVVALEYSDKEGFSDAAGRGRLVFFWFPKDNGGVQI